MDADGGNPRRLPIPLLNGIPHGRWTVSALPLLLVGLGALRVGIGKSTWWTPMGVISETFLTIPFLMIVIPHGLRTVNALPSCLIGVGTWTFT